MLGCSGISTLSASFMHLVEALAVQARRRVEDDVRRALAAAGRFALRHLPGRRSAAGRRRAGRATVRDDCWRSTSPSMTAWPRDGEIAREIGRQRRLADAALRVGDHDHRHAALPLSFCGYVSGARRQRHSASFMATTDPSPRRRSGRAGRRRDPRHRRPSASSSSRARTGACCRRRARCSATARRAARGARPLRALPRLPDRRRRRAGRAWRAARLVVWLQPIHWYSMPPLLKLWLDEVLAFGWAYGPGGDALARQGPLAGRHHRRPRGLVPPDRLQPLLLRRLPAALRADRGAVRHALPAAARAARRAQGERRRARRARRDLTRSGSPTIPPGRRSIWSRTASSARCRRARGRPIASWRPPDGARRLADRHASSTWAPR